MPGDGTWKDLVVLSYYWRQYEGKIWTYILNYNPVWSDVLHCMYTGGLVVLPPPDLSVIDDLGGQPVWFRLLHAVEDL